MENAMNTTAYIQGYMRKTAEDQHWYGVDLDGTLARYDGWKGVEHIGKPIPKMVRRVKRWLKDGKQVKILTARAAGDNGAARYYIKKWCRKHLGQELPITNRKDRFCVKIWDDRAKDVVRNTGDQRVTQTRR